MAYKIYGGKFDDMCYAWANENGIGVYFVWEDGEEENKTFVSEQEFRYDYEICDDCGDAFYRSDYSLCVAEDTGSVFCEDCVDSNLYYCDHCGNYYEDDHCDNGPHYRWCSNCADEYEEENYGRLRSYHASKYAGHYTFHRTDEEEFEDGVSFDKKNNRLYLGFEWEVDRECPSSDTLYEIEDLFGDFFSAEEDGSVSAEFVSEPATLAYHVGQRGDYEKMARLLLDDGCRAHDAGSCGLHVHASRAYFGAGKTQDYNIAKLLLLWERNYEGILKFSRRKSSQIHWCNRLEDTPVKTIKKAKDGELDRYFDVNLTNRNTIEFRMWRGTLNVDTLIATLKFTARLCELAKEHTAVECYKMSWEEILGTDPDIRNYWARRTGEAYSTETPNDEVDG